MGLKDDFKANLAGNKAYKAHAGANKLLDAGRSDEAEAMYKTAMDEYKNAEALGCKKLNIMTGYSVLLMRYGEFEKARAIIGEVYAAPGLSADDKFHLRLNHSVCQWKLGKLDKAIETMRGAMSHMKTGLSYNIMCSLLIEEARSTGDFTEAAALCAEALDYDDEDVGTLDNNAWLSYYTGDSDKAKAFFARALRINARYPSSLVGVSVIEHENGEDDKARKHIDAALAVHFPSTCPVSREFAENLKASI